MLVLLSEITPTRALASGTAAAPTAAAWGLGAAAAGERTITSHPAHQELLEALVVGDDAVVHHHKLLGIVRNVRVAVDGRRRAVGGPAGVGDAHMVLVHLADIQLLLLHVLLCQVLHVVDLAWGLYHMGLAVLQAVAVAILPVGLLRWQSVQAINADAG
jgi:hypothetical protein